MSNADLASHNGGMSDTGLRLGFEFYRLSRIPIARFDRQKQRFANNRPLPTRGPQQKTQQLKIVCCSYATLRRKHHVRGKPCLLGSRASILSRERNRASLFG
jgi:hypothetical protein